MPHAVIEATLLLIIIFIGTLLAFKQIEIQKAQETKTIYHRLFDLCEVKANAIAQYHILDAQDAQEKMIPLYYKLRE